MSRTATKQAVALPRVQKFFEQEHTLAQAGRLISLHRIVATSIPILVVLGWQLASTYGLTNSAVLPSPLACLQAWQRWIFGQSGIGLDTFSGTWSANVFNSLIRVVQGFGLAAALGIPLGILIGWYRSAAVLDPSIQLLRPVPITAWLPFSIAAFGIKDASAVFLIALGAFYPIVVSATQGARHTSDTLVRAARMLGASPLYLLRRVVIPSALPTIFVGLRLGIGVSWTAVIIAEMVSVKSGLGYVLWDAYYLGRMDIVLADMVSIGLLGFISDVLIVRLSGRFVGWRLR
jgi:NitT/TauT family transport system permease protein